MKRLVYLLCFCGWVGFADAQTAVVELFTSEGCSSCPPADVLLGELTQREWAGDVYGLAFHVDYWDRLGWKDRFSDKEFTRRQYRYSEVLTDTRVYTPQMVVDGRSGFVGSNRSRALLAIKDALARPDSVAVELSVEKVGPNRTRLAYTLSSVGEGMQIVAALVQRKTETDVKRGENVGRILHHSHVVRSFKHFAAGKKASGEARLSIPDDVTPDELDAIVYVQNRDRMTVLGAARVPLKGE